ncbi:MAG: GNAT family N-acetyltransferase [Steroidobacteraceae bacterium]
MLRAALLADAAELARLATQLGYPCDAGAMRARVARVLGDPAQCVQVLAHAEGGLQGWIHVARQFSLESGERIEILGLVVDEAARRSGAGQRLVACAAEWARSQGHAQLVVRSNVQRDVSHAFYRALGFEPSKTQHVYVRAL